MAYPPFGNLSNPYPLSLGPPTNMSLIRIGVQGGVCMRVVGCESWACPGFVERLKKSDLRVNTKILRKGTQRTDSILQCPFWGLANTTLI